MPNYNVHVHYSHPYDPDQRGVAPCAHIDVSVESAEMPDIRKIMQHLRDACDLGVQNALDPAVPAEAPAVEQPKVDALKAEEKPKRTRKPVQQDIPQTPVQQDIPQTPDANGALVFHGPVEADGWCTILRDMYIIVDKTNQVLAPRKGDRMHSVALTFTKEITEAEYKKLAAEGHTAPNIPMAGEAPAAEEAKPTYWHHPESDCVFILEPGETLGAGIDAGTCNEITKEEYDSLKAVYEAAAEEAKAAAEAKKNAAPQHDHDDVQEILGKLRDAKGIDVVRKLLFDHANQAIKLKDVAPEFYDRVYAAAAKELK